MNDELYSLDEMLDKLTKINNFEIEITKIHEDSLCPKLNSVKLYLSICKEIKRINEWIWSVEKSLDAHVQDYHNE